MAWVNNRPLPQLQSSLQAVNMLDAYQGRWGDGDAGEHGGAGE